ncbi:sensor histidine kinase [Mucilaginibacter sp. KACC 22063]|uniref:sensor histidine kinase n=1 Tax=Mucilaginibacter sp. KACC 22063 TaxID=3025666 RepID=UPI0023658DB0|nr:HAMP domain-containing sensor histidine kinase [Mucilaginibacter sp. KACC 22063]WDF53430.1 HAMP domain-containing sensor histidine kinase [Mucilaginibacter sp. KACC 22063]
MIFNRYEWRLILRVILLFLSLTAAALLLARSSYVYSVALLPVIIYLVIELMRFQWKAQAEVDQFVESVQYRDFSRHFDEHHAPNELKPLRKGFNEINNTFKTINREREQQYHYLQKVLELVNTGILSFEPENGEIGWINESFKKLLGIPYLKTIASLEKREPQLYQEVIGLKPGESKVVTLSKDRQLFKVLVTASLLRSENKTYKLLAFQNVSEALDENESKAWSKLLNVMTHEIMNSVAPISSLADTLKKRLQGIDKKDSVVSEDLEDLELGIDTIKRRSEGLLKFTESYRNLNKITKLDLEKVLVCDLFENLNTLMQPTLEKKYIELDIILRDLNLAIELDLNLIEQVLINLLINAIEAVKDRDEPQIILSGEHVGTKTIIKISDNGVGMPPEILEKIFIPFFSTRKTGSGIGLSLCKQIMQLHKGSIQVQSVEGQGSAFILTFNE